MSLKPGRNDRCPCGSGRKFKHCCGHAAPAPTPAHAAPAHAAPAHAVPAHAVPAHAAPSPADIGVLVGLIDAGRPADAETGARRLLNVHPAAGMLWKILGVALLRQGGDALHALSCAAQLLPRDAEAQRNLGVELKERGQWAPALEAFGRAVELSPQDADSLVDGADALRALGRAQDAIPWYRRALALDPERPDAHNNLGNAFLELGRVADAADSYRRALQRRPGDAQILLNLGGVLRELGQRREALTLFERAVDADPGRPDGHWLLGCVLFDLRRTADAADSYARALAIAPDHAPAHLSLGLALRQQRRAAEAEASCLAALALAPDYVEALAFLGELRADRGRFAEAEALFQRAIALNPDFSFGYFSIATHRRMTAADGAWFDGARALLARPLPLGHEISLRYALGKYHDDLRQFADAFDQYRRANDLTQRYGKTYDRADFARRVDEIIRSVDASFVREQAARGAASELPVFIVGMPRSGTSLTEQILASHPAVYGAGELPFWDVAYGAFRRSRQEEGGGDRHLPRLAADYLDRIAAAGGGARRVIDKMPANFLYAGLIHAALPRARIVHMQRHPLDTCLSIYFQNFFTMGPYANDLDNLAHYYREYLRIMEHWRAILPATVLLEVPYEGLIEDQEGWTRRLLDFIGLPWDPACLNFHLTERVVITASKWQVRQKLHGASAGRWRHYEPWLGPLKEALGAALPECRDGPGAQRY